MEEMSVRDGHVEKVASRDGWATPLAPSSLAFARITTVSNRQRDHHFYSLLGRCLSWANEGGGEGKEGGLDRIEHSPCPSHFNLHTSTVADCISILLSYYGSCHSPPHSLFRSTSSVA
jgi:hypothetical protein